MNTLFQSAAEIRAALIRNGCTVPEAKPKAPPVKRPVRPDNYRMELVSRYPSDWTPYKIVRSIILDTPIGGKFDTFSVPPSYAPFEINRILKAGGIKRLGKGLYEVVDHTKCQLAVPHVERMEVDRETMGCNRSEYLRRMIRGMKKGQILNVRSLPMDFAHGEVQRQMNAGSIRRVAKGEYVIVNPRLADRLKKKENTK